MPDSQFFLRISVKIAFALFASTGNYSICRYDKNFPTLQIVKYNQTLAQREVQRSKGFFSMDKPAGRALAHSP